MRIMSLSKLACSEDDKASCLVLNGSRLASCLRGNEDGHVIVSKHQKRLKSSGSRCKKAYTVWWLCKKWTSQRAQNDDVMESNVWPITVRPYSPCLCAGCLAAFNRARRTCL
jgi:hypothetical protein